MNRPFGLPSPLVRALPPLVAPDDMGRVTLRLLLEVRDRLLAGDADGAPMDEARFEIYRQASISWGDRWRVARVADFEEWVAEAAIQRNDYETAWNAWRAAHWIRHLLSGPGETQELLGHSLNVLSILRNATGRSN